ncbi:Uncharacterised protein [Klebsiella oxytoca]|nr:Uncharacterised protein [Klebsiella oxytoca]
MCFWSTADKRRPLKNVVVRAAPRHPVSLIQLYLLTVSDGTFWIRFSTQKQCVNHHHRLREYHPDYHIGISFLIEFQYVFECATGKPQIGAYVSA